MACFQKCLDEMDPDGTHVSVPANEVAGTILVLLEKVGENARVFQKLRHVLLFHSPSRAWHGMAWHGMAWLHSNPVGTLF